MINTAPLIKTRLFKDLDTTVWEDDFEATFGVNKTSCYRYWWKFSVVLF